MLHTHQATHDTKALLTMLQTSMRQNARAQQQTRTRYQAWRAQPKAGTPSGNMMLEAMAPALFDAFLGFLFTTPLLAPLGAGPEEAMIAGTAYGAWDGMTTRKPATEFNHYVLNDAVNEAQAKTFDETIEAQDAQAQQLETLQQITILLLQLLQQQQKATSTKAEATLASDVLRHPQLARFKQNRHSLDCIRTEFAKTADVVAPKFCGSRYTLAA